MEKRIFTRQDRLKDKCSHREFYSQFVTNRTINQVKAQIGIDRIKNSKDKHLNDIPLKNWDRFYKFLVFNTDMWKKATYPEDINHIHISLSDYVCIAKEAAKQIQEGIK